MIFFIFSLKIKYFKQILFNLGFFKGVCCVNYLNHFDLNKRTLAMVSSLAIQDPVNPTIAVIIIMMWWRILLSGI